MIYRKISKKKHFLSIIVPAYKQEKSISRDLLKIRKVLDQLRYRSEIICVVDGDSDKTYEKAKSVARKMRKVTVVGYTQNRGKGHAVRFGMARARGDIIGFIDAGMDLNPNGLSMLLEHFEWYQADVIVGSKRHPASKVRYPLRRQVLSFGYQTLVWLLFNLKVKDTQVGMKFYRREVLEKVLPRLLVKAFAFDIEILAVASYLGFKRIYEAPVEISLDFGGASSVTNKKFLITIMLMLKDTLAVFYRLAVLQYYSDVNKRRWKYDPDLDFKINLISM